MTPGTSRHGAPPDVAVLMPYWDFFEEAVDRDLRASREALLDGAAAVLRQAGTIGSVLWVDSRAAAERAAAELCVAQPAAVVVIQTMAVPPAWVAATLDAVPAAPVVLVALQERTAPGPSLGHAAITEHGATVGGAQLANVLVRRARRFRIVAGSLEQEVFRAELEREVRVARAARRMRGARVLRVGQPLEGYECVDCDADALRAATGITLVDLEPEAIRSAYLELGPEAVDPVKAEVEAAWRVEADAGTQLERSLRMAATLERIGQDHAAAAGAMNCHVPELRLGEDPGIAPCFALGRETSRGRPWTCTGDVVTAVAMLALKELGLAAWYHEIEALDHITDEALLACSGEHDLGLAARDERPTLRANPWWPGVCASFTAPAGPATLLAFTPAPGSPGGFRFIVAEGDFTARRLPETGTVNAAFRFVDGPVREAWVRWARAGANHHSAATRGHHAVAIHALAEHLGVGCVQV